MKILAVIPARGGSKGVPGKNIKLLNGKPLLAYTGEIALQSKLFEKVMLSSDDLKIISVGRKLGLEIPFVRPKHLAEDHSTTLDVIQHTLKFYKEKKTFFDAICLLQVTSPFRTISFLNSAIEKFANSNSDSLISVQKVPHQYNPHWTFEVGTNGYLKIATGEDKIIEQRQELPTAFHRDGSVYLCKTNIILNDHSLYGQNITYIESPEDLYVNIDTEKDWLRAETMANKINI